MTTLTAPARPVHANAILAIVLASYFMILLDNSVIFTAVPSIQADLDLSTTQLTWVQEAYTLVFGGLLLLGARAGDILGRKPVFVAGLATFSLASLLIGIAPTGEWLIGARALQGVGAAIVAPTSLALITASFAEGPERSRAVALYGAMAGIGASLGMLVGGAAVEWLTWRAGFLINVPIGILMILLAPRYLPVVARQRGRFDVVGAITGTLGVGALVFGITHSVDDGWTAPITIGSIAAGVVLLVVLVLTERTARQPIMPLRLFASAHRSGAYVARLLYTGAMIGFFFFTTQFMQGVLGMTAFEAGLGFLPMTIVNFVVAMLVPRIVHRVGHVVPLVVGVAITAVGMGWLSLLTPEAGYWMGVALPMLVIGVGQGLAFAPLTSAGVRGTTSEDAGAAAGLVNTFHQLGMAVGLGVLTALAHAFAAPTDLAGETAVALAAAAGLLVGSFLVSAIAIAPSGRRERRRQDATVSM